VQTEDGHFFSGYWPHSLWQNVVAAIKESGGGIERQDQQEGPASYFATIQAEALSRAVASVTDAVAVTGRAWEELVASLPALSQLVEALPRSEASVSGAIKWFSPRQNEWVDAADVAAVGGYRATRFSTLDFVRTKADVNDGTIAHSSVQLSKHVAALLTDRPMVAYNRATWELVVPLGADLPGLYGRAVVAASGVLPTADLRNRLLVYHAVPQTLAGHIYHLLSS
jgi:hypothetical protein